MKEQRPPAPPISPRFRMVLWLAIGIVPVIIYPILAYMVSNTGYTGQTEYSDSIIGAFVALGIIVLFFNLGLMRRTQAETNDRSYILCLAMAEAIGIEGFVLYLIIGWNWGFWAMLVMSLLSALPLRPRGARG
ncbi:MAG TPA: hypothetical protein VFD74_05355 [Thermoleophilia bacterium]|nr:hypothetical protein [Thermoleophilia bacterium]